MNEVGFFYLSSFLERIVRVILHKVYGCLSAFVLVLEGWHELQNFRCWVWIFQEPY